MKRLLFNILCLYINYCTVLYVCEHLGLFANKPDNNVLIIQYKYVYFLKGDMLCQKLSGFWKTTELRIMGMLV